MTLFAVPDRPLVPETAQVVLNGELQDLPEYDEGASQLAYVNSLDGTIKLETAPPEGAQLRVSYYFQWFMDNELAEFLTSGAQVLDFDSAEDADLPTKVRAPVLSFAAHYAYLKLAANAAQALTSGAGGYTGDNTREHPNWMAMAELAWKTAKEELETVAQSPLTLARPAMRFVSFALPRYVPRS